MSTEVADALTAQVMLGVGGNQGKLALTPKLVRRRIRREG